MLRLVLPVFIVSVVLLGCGGPASSSERSVLPGFEVKQLAHKRVLLAPYSPGVVSEERSIPLSVAQVRTLAAYYPDSEDDVTSLKAFYFAGEWSAKKSVIDSGSGLFVVSIDAPRWHDYFESPEQFLNVSVDGKVHYQIPQRGLLQRLDRDADFAIVIGSLEYTSAIVTTKSDTTYNVRRTASCDANFLIWDYQANRALAEGKVDSAVGFGKEVTSRDYQDLGAQVVAEIMSKRPFR